MLRNIQTRSWDPSQVTRLLWDMTKKQRRLLCGSQSPPPTPPQSAPAPSPAQGGTAVCNLSEELARVDWCGDVFTFSRHSWSVFSSKHFKAALFINPRGTDFSVALRKLWAPRFWVHKKIKDTISFKGEKKEMILKGEGRGMCPSHFRLQFAFVLVEIGWKTVSQPPGAFTPFRDTTWGCKAPSKKEDAASHSELFDGEDSF